MYASKLVVAFPHKNHDAAIVMTSKKVKWLNMWHVYDVQIETDCITLYCFYNPW